MVADANEIITFGFGLLAVLMSALFYLQTHKTHLGYSDKFKDYSWRLDDYEERTAKLKKRSKQIRLVQKIKAGVKEAEKLFSKATSKALAKVSVKARSRRRKK